MGLFTSDVTVEGGSTNVPISGTVTANQGTAAAPAGSWTVEVTDGTNILGTSAHPLQVSSALSSTSTLTRVTASANTNIQLVAANANRKKVIIWFPSGNNSTYVKFGVTASATSYTYVIPTNNSSLTETIWQGEIDYFGPAQTISITELT